MSCLGGLARQVLFPNGSSTAIRWQLKLHQVHLDNQHLGTCKTPRLKNRGRHLLDKDLGVPVSSGGIRWRPRCLNNLTPPNTNPSMSKAAQVVASTKELGACTYPGPSLYFPRYVSVATYSLASGAVDERLVLMLRFPLGLLAACRISAWFYFHITTTTRKFSPLNLCRSPSLRHAV